MAKPYEVTFGKFLLSQDKKKIDLTYVYDLLCIPSERSSGLPEDRFPLVIENSECFGVYDGEKQVAFARVITDYSEFASLWDVYVDEEYRKKGIGKAFMKMLLDAPNLKGVFRWFLMTEDAHSLYEKYGFKREVLNPYIMMRTQRL